MEVPVIIEPVIRSGYRVIGAGGLSLGLSAEGSTAAEAMDKLALQIQTRLHSGAKLTELNFAATEGEAPWKQDTGYLKDDQLYQPWLDSMAENRRRLDADPQAL